MKKPDDLRRWQLWLACWRRFGGESSDEDARQVRKLVKRLRFANS
jgi:hypothetical protein